MDDSFPVNFSYQVYESASGTDESLTPVIFLHGVMGSKEMWDDIPQIMADKTRRKTLAYDARNHGNSDHSNIFSFELNVDDLFYFMDTMKIPKAIVVGHSMGGFTASRAALRNPERIEMMFSEDMYVKKLTEELIDSIRGFAELLVNSVKSVPSSTDEKEVTKAVFNQLFSQASPDASYAEEKENLSKTKFIFKRKPDGGYDVSFNKDAIIKAFQNYDTLMKDASGVFAGPAYFLYGSRSFMNVGGEEEHIKKHFPNAELIKFEGATHNVHVEYPEKFVNTILNCLKNKNQTV